MISKEYIRTNNACRLTCFSTAVTANLSPLLFVTFRETYGISYSLLGFLVVLNFGTQLLFDLVFSFFSHKFNIPRAVKLTPVIMTAGLLLFAAAPLLFPNHIYFGLALATVVFSAGGGLAEVLISPTVAAIPSDNPDQLMSFLHSCYAWGVVLTVAVSTGFIFVFGAAKWQILALVLTLLPFGAAVMMAFSKIPPMQTPEKASGAVGILKNKTVFLYVVCIFLGGAAECTMSQWCSGFLETAFGIEKWIGDLCGMALFGAMLGLGRSLYGKFGKNIHRVLILGAVGASVCYVTVVVSRNPVIGLLACAFTGFCVSMLWPGNLIAVEKALPNGGVALYALMAMGGDMGASLCPQGVGLITDAVIASKDAVSLAAKFGITVEQLGMKAGMAFAALFPLAAVALFAAAKRNSDKHKTGDEKNE